MSFRLVHTADWQIGKPFGSLPPEKAVIVRRARDEAIERIADAARAAGAGHVLVAGDIFDREALPDVLLRQTMNRLAAGSPLIWHLLPGNHDPAAAGGIWDAVRRLGLPPNVRLHLVPEPTEIAAGVQLLPAPLRARSTATDPTHWMDTASTPEGHLRVGMAHGSIQGFGSLGEAAVPIDPQRARKAGLAYLALGDWHGTKKIGVDTWYSGTPEPDSFAANDPGHVLSVALAGASGPPVVDVVATASLQWRTCACKDGDTAALDRLEQEIARTAGAVDRWLVELSLTGRMSASAIASVERRLQTLEGRVFHLAVDRRQLALQVTGDDVSTLAESAARTVAETLGVDLAGADPVAARRAGRALELLFALDAEVAAEEASTVSTARAA